MANWKFTESYVVPQRVTEISTTAKVPVGTIARARDEDNGYAGEFIYLLGVANTVAGSWVVYNQEGATELLVADHIGPIAIAMAANVASSYGWYQISGRGVGRATSAAIASGATLYSTATAGQVNDAVVSGDVVYNAWPVAAKATTPAVVSTFAVELARPWATDRIIA